MLKSIIISLLYISLYPSTSLGQDYFAYQKAWYQIDKHIEQKQYNEAITQLDIIAYNYTFIYARHCFKALQICCSTNDSIRAERWLSQTFARGVPMWMVRHNELTKKALTYHSTKTVLQQYKKLRAQYYSSINDSLSKVIDSLLSIDQKITHKVNDGFILSRAWHDVMHWKKNNAKSFKAINQIMTDYHYPGERLIGLPQDLQDSVKAYAFFSKYGPETIKDHRAYTMLIHYFSDKRPPIDDKLYNNVQAGYLPAYQYSTLQDFRSEWGHADNYYNVWHTAKDPTSKIDEVNKRRAAIGLDSYEAQQKTKQVRLDRLKNKTANKLIILE